MIYLPSCEADGSPIPGFEKLADRTARDLSGKFGGATIYPATGYFTSASNKAQKEAVHVLEFFCTPDQLSSNEEFLWSLVVSLGKDLNQESMGCSLDGNMLLVSGNSPDS